MQFRVKNLSAISFAFAFCLFFCSGARAQCADYFLGFKLRPELQAIIKEIERKSGEKIYAEFVEHKDYMFGSSYITDGEGVPVVLVDYGLENDRQKLEAVSTVLDLRGINAFALDKQNFVYILLDDKVIKRPAIN